MEENFRSEAEKNVSSDDKELFVTELSELLVLHETHFF